MTKPSTPYAHPSLPASVLEDEYGDLSVIQVTSRSEDFETPTITPASDTTSSQDWSSCKKSKVGTPRSVSSLLSTLTRGWSKTGSKESEGEDSVLQNAIFSSIDGEDAREFGDFLVEDGGELFRIPVLCLAEFGKEGSWPGDVVVIMQNTIRRELMDVLEIVRVIRREFLSLTVYDVYQLRQWWRLFVQLWKIYERYEEQVVNPLVQQIVQVDGRGDVLRRKLEPLRENWDWLKLKMEELTSYVEEFEALRPGRVLVLFCKTVDIFAERAALYFNNRERLLPRFIDNYHNVSLKAQTESTLISYLRSTKHFPELLICLTRWMGNTEGTSPPRKKEVEKWLCGHLGWFERQNLHRFYDRYHKVHGGVVQHFRGKLRGSDSL